MKFISNFQIVFLFTDPTDALIPPPFIATILNLTNHPLYNLDPPHVYQIFCLQANRLFTSNIFHLVHL